MLSLSPISWGGESSSHRRGVTHWATSATSRLRATLPLTRATRATLCKLCCPQYAQGGALNSNNSAARLRAHCGVSRVSSLQEASPHSCRRVFVDWEPGLRAVASLALLTRTTLGACQRRQWLLLSPHLVISESGDVPLLEFFFRSILTPAFDPSSVKAAAPAAALSQSFPGFRRVSQSEALPRFSN